MRDRMEVELLKRLELSVYRSFLVCIGEGV